MGVFRLLYNTFKVVFVSPLPSSLFCSCDKVHPDSSSDIALKIELHPLRDGRGQGVKILWRSRKRVVISSHQSLTTLEFSHALHEFNILSPIHALTKQCESLPPCTP